MRSPERTYPMGARMICHALGFTYERRALATPANVVAGILTHKCSCWWLSPFSALPLSLAERRYSLECCVCVCVFFVPFHSIAIWPPPTYFPHLIPPNAPVSFASTLLPLRLRPPPVSASSRCVWLVSIYIISASDRRGHLRCRQAKKTRASQELTS